MNLAKSEQSCIIHINVGSYINTIIPNMFIHSSFTDNVHCEEGYGRSA